MIYFFHHYELPALVQQAQIQNILMQNQPDGGPPPAAVVAAAAAAANAPSLRAVGDYRRVVQAGLANRPRMRGFNIGGIRFRFGIVFHNVQQQQQQTAHNHPHHHDLHQRNPEQQQQEQQAQPDPSEPQGSTSTNSGEAPASAESIVSGTVSVGQEGSAETSAQSAIETSAQSATETSAQAVTETDSNEGIAVASRTEVTRGDGLSSTADVRRELEASSSELHLLREELRGVSRALREVSSDQVSEVRLRRPQQQPSNEGADVNEVD